MSNHIHLLAKSPNRDLSDVVREFKSFTARKILKAIEEEPESRRDWMLNLFEFAAKKHKRCEKYQFWTHENHPEIIYSNKFVDQKINYVHENPVRAGIVEYADDYLYSSARAYTGKDCFLEIIPVIRSVEKPGLMRSIR